MALISLTVHSLVLFLQAAWCRMGNRHTEYVIYIFVYERICMIISIGRSNLFNDLGHITHRLLS